MVKEFLAGSRFDILTLFKRLEVFYNEHTADIELNNNSKIRRDCRSVLYGGVANQITNYALGETAKQLRIPNSTPPKPCSGLYTASTGIPCKHQLQQLIERGELLQVSNFHPHWWVDRSKAPQLPTSIRPLEPRIIIKK